MEQILPWIISVVGGAVGGNIAGVLGFLKKLGPLLKTVLGGLGGLIGGQLLPKLGVLEAAGHGENAGYSAGAGALLTLLAGLFKKK